MREIQITLCKDDWIDLAKFLARKSGEMADILPVALLIQELMNNGVSINELKQTHPNSVDRISSEVPYFLEVLGRTSRGTL